MGKQSNILLTICIALIAVFCFVGMADAAPCRDRDNDGYSNQEGCGTAVDCDDRDPAVNPGAVEECTDGIDNDCDGLIDIQDPDAVNCPVCTDNDSDGYNIEGGGCGAVDCNDADPAINPGAAEICTGGVDEDCDDLIDDNDPDCQAPGCSDYTSRNACNNDPNCEWVGSPKNGSCQDSCNITEDPEVTCDDGIDNDCDGNADTADSDCLTCTDNDGDGYNIEGGGCGQVDCNDNDPAVNPGASEGPNGDPTCSDTVDNDCDGLIDTAQDPGCAPFDCSQFTKRKDCTANPECIWEGGMCVSVPTCTDNDGDGYGVGAACLGPDCNDNDPSINPEADDSNCDNIDDNCSGTPDDGYVPTPTNCGVGVCAASGQLECQGGVEVDTCTPGPQDEPTDVTCDGLDGDCDGPIDEDYTATPTTCGVGECSGNAGQLECQSGSEVDTCDPLAGAAADDSLCNGLDDDCDGPIDEDYTATPTTCGVGECSGNTGQLECQSGSEVDTCDPLAGAAADDSLCNGLDDDCDGPIDEDYTATPTTCGVGECSGNTGQLECQSGSEVDTCDPLAGAAPNDSVCNGLDDDCDGPIDEDYTATPTTCGVGECSGNAGQLECQSGSEVDTCDPIAGAGVEGPEGDPTCGDTLDNDCDGDTDIADQDCACVPTGSPDDNCDGIDDDCNGTADDAYVATPTTCGVGECSGNAGQLECQGGSTVDTCDPLAGATADDSLCNGLDDDCDGPIDEDYTATPTTCGVGECSGNAGQLECQGGSEVDTCDPLAGAAADDSLCNGLDDDCDGPIDEDYTATPTTCGVGECSGNAGQLECQSGSEVDTCDPLAGAAADDSVCNGLDDDCDGPVDEDYSATPTTCGVGECSGNAGQLECQSGSEVDTCDPLAGAAADDSLCNGLDDDCDGLTDEDYVASTTNCGVGVCSATGLLECQSGSEVDSCTPGTPQTEGPPVYDPTCLDGLDNDCDGTTDAGDADCDDAADAPHDIITDCTLCHDPGTYVPDANIENIKCLGCHDGSQATQVLNHYSDTYIDPTTGVLVDIDCVECHNPMRPQPNLNHIRGVIRGKPVVFTAQTGAGSYADGDATYDGICEVCHTQTQHHRNDGSAPAQSHNDGQQCTLCHEHINGFIPGPGGGCTDCHNGIPSGGSGYVTRDVVGVDYVQPSRHVFGGTVTNWDCIVCHREGDANQAAAGVVANTAVHQNAQVEMRNVDSINTGGVWDKNNTSDAMYTDLDNFCMGCHDPDGASGINVKATDDGVNLDNSRALTPFNSSDGLSSTGTAGGTVSMLPDYERMRVLDVFSKFDPNNPSHHAVRGQAYGSHNANWGDGAWVSRTLKSGDNLIGVYEAARLHCTDCHAENSHGGPNGFRLQAASIDETCWLCHNSNVYSNSSSTLTRWSHDNESSAMNQGVGAKIGQYGGTQGSMCMNCHGGNIGEGGSFIDGFGGIHGLPSGSDSRSTEERYRFQGGSYMSHSPSSWTGTSGSTPTCYFSGSAAQDWSNCAKHTGTLTNRTAPPQYSRGVPGDY